jgi:ABC-type transport system involved in multi-copper enzyme maturation permease subunit
MRASLIIAGVTLKESIRDRIFIGLLLFLVLLLGFSVYLATLSLGDVARVIQNMGMFSVALMGLTVTLLFGLYALYQEQERNELYVLLNRISRGEYLLGKFLGAGGVIAIFIAAMAAGLFLLTWLIGGVVAPWLFLDAAMAVLEFTLLMAIGLFFYSCGIRFTLNALFILLVFITGHSFNEAIDSFVALGRLGNEYHLLAVTVLSYLLPNFDLFDFRLAIVHGQPIPLIQPLLSLVYWGCYVTGLLVLAQTALKRRSL